MTFVPLIILIIIFVIPIVIALLLSSQNRSSYQNRQGSGMLCKSQSNRVFAGVCGGIAEHFGWNASFVRIFFIFSGIGIFTYILLSIIIPDSPSSLL
ncbi:PspC domain-containing protein [Anaerovorax odorimutans]|uniref:PspC domain-containing protein n=1 Tax=Anaerovorax odorimutans TaxID=109327 RepID=UPI0003FCED84|nr:PspC domain-containing protein [Anaerovorax odorimutans]